MQKFKDISSANWATFGGRPSRVHCCCFFPSSIPWGHVYRKLLSIKYSILISLWLLFYCLISLLNICNVPPDPQGIIFPPSIKVFPELPEDDMFSLKMNYRWIVWLFWFTACLSANLRDAGNVLMCFSVCFLYPPFLTWGNWVLGSAATCKWLGLNVWLWRHQLL